MSSPVINAPTPPSMSHVTSANGSQDFSQTKLQTLSCGANPALESAALIDYMASKISPDPTPCTPHVGKPSVNIQANPATRPVELQGLHVASANPQSLHELLALSPFLRDSATAAKASEATTVKTPQAAYDENEAVLKNEREYYLALRDARSQLLKRVRGTLRALQAARAKKNALDKRRMRRGMQMRKTQQQQARGSVAVSAKVATAAATTNNAEVYGFEKKEAGCGYGEIVLECSAETEVGLESDRGHVFSKQDMGADDGGWHSRQSSPTALSVENSSEMESSEEEVTLVGHTGENVTDARKIECVI